jgi:hypothetical protein
LTLASALLLVLDGLEPLQNPPGPQEGRLREPSLQALLREFAAFNTGLCVITTRMPVADIADHERASALRRELEQLSSDAGAKLLRALGEGPELSVLRMLGLFDRPADEKALGALLKPPAIWGLTESLIDLSPTEWRTILAKLRRARLLAGEDPHNPGDLDTRPLVREYFGEPLRSQRTEAWKECNKRLYNYYRTLAPQLPEFCALAAWRRGSPRLGAQRFAVRIRWPALA